MIKGFPSIPNLSPEIIDSTIGFGAAAAINIVFGNQWGIYSTLGVPILLADTVLSVKYENNQTISNAPVEKGTFASYNKVQDPYKATVSLVKGGSNPTLRGAFLAQIEALSKSTTVFNIVTPEFVHRNASIVGYDYIREPNNGARMLTLNINLQEVREFYTQFDVVETSNPADSTTVDNGQIQTSSGESLLSRFSDKIGGLF